MTTVITICDTCKHPDRESSGAEETDGETLALLVEASASGEPGVDVRRHSCLMGCGRGCNLAIGAPGKITYVLGDFTPDLASAGAIVEYARRHAASDTGQVPFRQWPQGIKGHFTARLPVPEWEAK
ncbi:MAG: DUF1636 family protein [Paracoccaceae bacterium]